MVLNRHDWVVYAKTPLAGPEVVLDYLSRYTHRVAVSNERIVAVDATGVRLRVRADNRGGGIGDSHRRRRLLHLPAPAPARWA